MRTPIPRLRMFAGPNGSGKSTLKSVLPLELLGVYLNPDEIEAILHQGGSLDLDKMGVVTTQAELAAFLAGSALLQAERAVATPQLADGRLKFPQAEVNSYLASALVDFLRQRLIASQTPFTFETVMSHPGKVAILKQAQQSGFRTYLYYIATNDPEINISRVRNRVRLGGHPVPEDKIVSRYHRSLDLLMDAIRFTHRAFIFDNSGHDQDRTWLAEVTDGRILELKSDVVPAWFQRAVLSKLPAS